MCVGYTDDAIMHNMSALWELYRRRHRHLSKQNEQTYKQSKSIKNTYNIGLDAKVHVGLFNRLHVTHKK